MTVQTINIGNVVNDGLGDDLRTAFEKVNANFTTLDSSLTITASNIGATGVGVFKQKTDADLEFKNLVAGRNMAIDDNTNTLEIRSTAPDAFTRFDTDSGSMLASTYQQITIAGAPALGTRRADIEVTTSGSTLSIKNIIPVTDILETFDFGPLNGLFTNSIQMALAASNVDFGTIDYPSRYGLDCGTLA
jgi:hypothetical protein